MWESIWAKCVSGQKHASVIHNINKIGPNLMLNSKEMAQQIVAHPHSGIAINIKLSTCFHGNNLNVHRQMSG